MCTVCGICCRSLGAMVAWAKHLLMTHQHKADFKVDELLDITRTKVSQMASAVKLFKRPASFSLHYSTVCTLEYSSSVT